MRRHAKREVTYQVWRHFVGEGWVSWGNAHTTLAKAQRDLATNYRVEPGDRDLFQIVKVTLERMSSPRRRDQGGRSE